MQRIPVPAQIVTIESALEHEIARCNLKIKLLTISFVCLLAICCASCSKTEAPATPIATKLRVGYIPIADCAQLFVAQDRGYFQAEGLAIELMPMAGGAKILEALQGGSVDVGFSNVVSLALAKDAGLPFVAITGGPLEDRQHIEHAILIATDSHISDLKDLRGKRLALNTRKNIDDLMVTELLRMHGIAPSSVNYAEIPFPRMLDVLRARQVDAVAAIEPFVTAGIRSGQARVLSYNYLAVQPETLISVYVIQQQTLINSDVAARFARAIQKASTYANTHTEEVRALIGKYSHLDISRIRDVPLPLYTQTVNPKDLQTLLDVMRRRGWLRTNLAPADLYTTPK